jgi:DNA-binding response OmpR family regulator
MANVLIVEDDPDIAELVALKLQLDGHTVTTEEDGDAGLAAVREDVPDLVLLDWMSASWVFAVSRMTGIDSVRGSARMASQISIPVRRGIIQSSSTRSGTSSRTAARPASPSSSVVTV